MSRPELTAGEINEAIVDLAKGLQKRLEQHGHGTFTSSHEVYGVLAEELHEFLMEVQNNDREAQTKEAMDIAVGALFGYACLKSGKADW